MSSVARRYARALLDLASDHRQLEAFGAELEALARTTSSPELAARLASPELGQQSRELALATITERLNLSFPLRSFAIVAARHGRTAQFAEISRAYQALADERLGRARARLIFALRPRDEDVSRVVAALGAIARKTIIPTIDVDARLLGGMVAELEGKTYDGSLKTRLQEAERTLAG